ncbi:hypothetical protein Glove_345g52 [Diversispora epigaea]|uniref:Uncharacterized protein n=1 Tax=Diversispora epigaea TaxID=1348612 RepID=A0A397HN73_9GLOM|nr:hypothetical protein Glove_345g52 [Diversispora epigaea]
MELRLHMVTDCDEFKRNGSIDNFWRKKKNSAGVQIGGVDNVAKRMHKNYEQPSIEEQTKERVQFCKQNKLSYRLTDLLNKTRDYFSYLWDPVI